MNEATQRSNPTQGNDSNEETRSDTAHVSGAGLASTVSNAPDGEHGTPSDSRSKVISRARESFSHLSLPRPQTVGIGAGVVLAGGAVAGAWQYRQWQAERSRPINRLRRGAQEMTSRVGMRSGKAPLGGAATAAVLSTLVLARALKRTQAEPRTRGAQAKATLDELTARARGRMAGTSTRLPAQRGSRPR